MTEEFSGVSQLTIATTASSIFPGFKFSPSDEELVSYYLQKKMDGLEKSVEVIRELDICNYEPWDLPAESIMQSKCEWFFFNARGRKYSKGSHSRRTTEKGYWKATGKERIITADSIVVGKRRTLVFHMGRAPKGERTEWIMHEYCMGAQSPDSTVVCRLKLNYEFRPKEGSLAQPQQPSTSQPSTSQQQPSTSDGSFGQQKDVCPHDSERQGDWYSEIIKRGGIFNVDEALLPTKSEPKRRKYEQTTQTLTAHVQGNANRRLRLKTSDLKTFDLKTSKSKNDSKDSPKCILSQSKRVVNWQHWFVVFLVLSLLIIVASFLGWFRSVKSEMYTVLFKNRNG